MAINYLVRQEQVKIPNEVQMQIIDIYEEDVEIDTEKQYIVNLFGLNEQGHSVHVQVNGFTPFFYIKVPKQFQKYQVEGFVEFLTDKYFASRNYSYPIIEKAKIVKRIDFRGFRNGKKDKFVKLSFKTKQNFGQMRYFLRNYNEQLNFQGMYIWPKTYESKMDPFLSFFHLQDLRTAGWINIKQFQPCFTSKCQIDVQAYWKDVVRPDKNGIAPILQASFDIECVAGDGVSFPEWSKDKDVINQIGTTMYIYGQDNSITPFKHIVTLKSCSPINGVIIESYKTEGELLVGWAKLLERLQPDILTGYNIYQFDFEYIYQRAKKLGVRYAFENLSRLKAYYSPKNKSGDFLASKFLSSAAMGDNELKFLLTPGMLQIDLLKVIQREYKLESYKLDNVASEFIKGKIKKVSKTASTTKFTINPGDIKDMELGNYVGVKMNKLQYYELDDTQKWKIIKINGNVITVKGRLDLPKDILLEWTLKKDDLPPKELFAYQDKGPTFRKQIAIYCIQDNILCNKLLDKLKIIANNVGMANVCSVPMSFIFMRGQGIKAYSLVGKQCKKDGYLIPDIQPSSNQTFQGATVLSAKTGAHFEPVACNDFSSLYPSSIISHNLSPDTLIENDRHFDNVETHDIRWEDKDENNVVTNTYCYTFTTPEGEDNHDSEYQRDRKGRGIIPRVLIDLLDNRKKVKKMMAQTDDPFEKSLLDGLQLSYKLTCNSIYGQMGSSVSPISCMPVAMCTTSVGRQLLVEAARVMKEMFPQGKIIYGDSVTGDTQLILRNNNIVKIKTIESLAEEWKSYDELKPFDTLKSNRREKQQALCSYEVWSKDGWNPIKRVIRHKCNKNIFKVISQFGTLKVTGDHSLIDADGNYIKPSDCKIGSMLMHSTPYKGNFHGKILQIENIGHTDDFVYDLETVSGTFGTFSTICAKNTDSVFYQYPIPPECELTDEKIAHAIKCAQAVENRVSEILPWPHKLEYEKTYYPYILLSKKRYMGVMYEMDPKNYSKVDTKGIVMKRRDNAKIVKYIYGGAMNIILFQRDLGAAHEFVRDTLRKLIRGEFSNDLLVISKALKKTKTVPAHRMLADRIAKRDPGNAPQLNDRIPYIYVYIDPAKEAALLKAQGRKKLLQGDKIEHPVFIKENGLKPDYAFYITNQILKPLMQLLAVFVQYDHPELSDEEILKRKEAILERDLFMPFINQARRDQTGQRSIMDFF